MKDAPGADAETCWLPKLGHDPHEYEDAAATHLADWPVRAAVADGATESVFARTWAETLVARYVDGQMPTASTFTEQLPEWQATWQTAIEEQTTALPWYTAAKVEEGAFATFLGLTVQRDGRWHALAVGDCNFFHLREDTLLRSWPWASAGAFTHRPALVPSRSAADPPDLQEAAGTWEAGDTVILATDASAAWLLATDPTQATALTADTFAPRAAKARRQGALRNDDATLVLLSL